MNKKIAEKKEEILEIARRMGTEEDAHDYITDMCVAGAELVELEEDDTSR